jgi:tetratricopeptide (TPR) repeat protein
MPSLTYDDLEKNFSLLKKSPEKFLELANEFVRDQPEHSGGYFSRHFAWEKLGQVERALEDLRTAHRLGPKVTDFYAMGRVLHSAGRFAAAVDALNAAERDDPGWKQGRGPFIRADCHARLGNLDAALADCECLSEDHFFPYGFLGLPKGDKQQVIEKIRRLAAEARGTARPS